MRVRPQPGQARHPEAAGRPVRRPARRLRPLGLDVSVVIPARNAGRTLRACLRSLTRQTLQHWECLLVDDGSTDDTGAVARQAAAGDSRIRVLSQAPLGLIPALNFGLQQSAGRFVARMDADDVMHRERLAAQVAALDRNPALAAVGCHVRIFPRAAMSPRLREYEAWLNALDSTEAVRRDAFVECPVAHPSLMMRREMAALGYEDRSWPEDYDLVLRALTDGMAIGVVPRRLLAWRFSPTSHSRTDARYRDDRFVACKAHYLARSFLADTSEYVLWGYGGTGRALRRALAAEGKTPSHIVEVKPSRLGERIHGAPVVPPSALRELRAQPLVVSVARLAPRTEIRAALGAMQFVEGRDYICAA